MKLRQGISCDLSIFLFERKSFFAINGYFITTKEKLCSFAVLYLKLVKQIQYYGTMSLKALRFFVQKLSLKLFIHDLTA